MKRSKSHQAVNNAKDISANSEHDAVALIEKNYSILTEFKARLELLSLRRPSALTSSRFRSQANMKDCKVIENTELLCNFRDNITQAIQLVALKAENLNLPPLPQLNLDLANKFLPPRLPGVPGGSPSAASFMDGAPASSFACMPFGGFTNIPTSNSPPLYSMAPSGSHR
jgi:hypothetical protein